MGDQHHMDKSAAYRATLFLTHRTSFLTLRTWLASHLARHDSGASGKQRNAKNSARRMLS
jgi:hypothetical protein